MELKQYLFHGTQNLFKRKRGVKYIYNQSYINTGCKIEGLYAGHSFGLFFIIFKLKLIKKC